ncbi:MAG: hypothetical protein Q9214_002206 [Letrouitia sp. 1 TL-2023]
MNSQCPEYRRLVSRLQCHICQRPAVPIPGQDQPIVSNPQTFDTRTEAQHFDHSTGPVLPAVAPHSPQLPLQQSFSSRNDTITVMQSECKSLRLLLDFALFAYSFDGVPPLDFIFCVSTDVILSTSQDEDSATLRATVLGQNLTLTVLRECFASHKDILPLEKLLNEILPVTDQSDSGVVSLTKSCTSRQYETLCQRLSITLNILCHPKSLIAKSNLQTLYFLPSTLSAIFYQLSYNAVSVLEQIFRIIENWVFSARDKSKFAKQKLAIASGLGRVYTGVQRFGTGLAEWSRSLAAFSDLGLHVPSTLDLLSHLGNGIDDRGFENGQKENRSHFSSISVTLHPRLGHSAQDCDDTLLTYEVSFFDILTDAVAFNGDATGAWVKQQASRKNVPTHAISKKHDEKQFTSNDQGKDSSDAFLDNMSLDPAAEIARILIYDLKDRIAQEKEAHQGRIRELEEQVSKAQLCLGDTTPPAPPKHILQENIFDSDEPNSNSPGAITLVEPCEDSGQELVVKSMLPGAGSSLTGHHSVDEKHSLKDVEMTLEDHIMPAHSFEAAYSKPRENLRKRKSCSKSGAFKKTRMDTTSAQTKPQCQAETFKQNILESANDGKFSLQAEVDTEPGFLTLRPNSWPRSRRFRKSAGVSVKKLTDMFERLRVPTSSRPVPLS